MNASAGNGWLLQAAVALRNQRTLTTLSRAKDLGGWHALRCNPKVHLHTPLREGRRGRCRKVYNLKREEHHRPAWRCADQPPRRVRAEPRSTTGDPLPVQSPLPPQHLSSRFEVEEKLAKGRQGIGWEPKSIRAFHRSESCQIRSVNWMTFPARRHRIGLLVHPGLRWRRAKSPPGRSRRGRPRRVATGKAVGRCPSPPRLPPPCRPVRLERPRRRQTVRRSRRYPIRTSQAAPKPPDGKDLDLPWRDRAARSEVLTRVKHKVGPPPVHAAGVA